MGNEERETTNNNSNTKYNQIVKNSDIDGTFKHVNRKNESKTWHTSKVSVDSIAQQSYS